VLSNLNFDSLFATGFIRPAEACHLLIQGSKELKIIKKREEFR
jgi:hypothetical protein